MKYFAYGSNMCSSRLKSRVPSCKIFDVGILKGHILKFHKRSIDDSGKCNVVPSQNGENEVIGVVFEFDTNEKILLDKAEGKEYKDISVEVITSKGNVNAYMYVASATSVDDSLIPYTWYKDFVVEGAKEHFLPKEYIQTLIEIESMEDYDEERVQKNKDLLPCNPEKKYHQKEKFMEIKEIPITDIQVSEFNTRKDLEDGQVDSTIEDLAHSIQKQGLLSPITVYQNENGKYALIAGQRRMLACKYLGWSEISAIVRDKMSTADATAISLVENVHRADMNPRDKALAFKTLFDNMGDLQSVSRETGVGVQTIRKYIQLLGLATELQEQLAAGETKNTQALANLTQKVKEPEEQVRVWGQIEGFNQGVQQEIIKRLVPDLSNLDDLRDKATEGILGAKFVRNCPYDCSTIPDALKEQVAQMINWHKTAG